MEIKLRSSPSKRLKKETGKWLWAPKVNKWTGTAEQLEGQVEIAGYSWWANGLELQRDFISESKIQEIIVWASEAMLNNHMERSGSLATCVQRWINCAWAEWAFSFGVLWSTTQEWVRKMETRWVKEWLFACGLCSGLLGLHWPWSLTCHLQSVSNGSTQPKMY